MTPRVLDILVSRARKRITADEYVKPPEPKVSATVRRLHQRYKTLDRAKDQVTEALKRQGYSVGYKNALSRNNNYSKARMDFDHRKAARGARLNQLHEQALIDLLDATEKTAKAYLIRLKKKLEAI